MTIKTKKRNPSVVIVGAGMTGILMTIKLREAGITDITILEKKDNIGGTWRENTYPGVACDVPAHMYTYQFEPNPEWSHRFAAGSEIQDYFERVGRKYGVTESVRFNEAVTSAHYKDGKWIIGTSKNDTITADFFISATGILHHPAKPEFKGMETFKGAIFHTAEWDHSVELKDKKVGIIGTGSTAAQVISELPKTVNNLTVFQRTPQWLLKIPNKVYPESLKQKCRKSPLRMEIARIIFKNAFEQIMSKFVTGGKFQNVLVKFLCKRYLNTVKDPVLRQKLTPNYKPGCKRLVMSSTFYDAIQRPNVDLITDGIEEFTENGIKTKDGNVHELDAIVLSTGFDPVGYMRPMNLTGKSGVDIDTYWSKKIQAYRSLCLSDYPNFFLMLGPNTPIGNFSVIMMSEVQAGYVLKMIERWRNSEFDEFAVKEESLKAFNKYLKDGMATTNWVSGGCQSWYLDADGDPLTWPYSWKQWVNEMEEPDMSHFATRTYPQADENKDKKPSKVA